MLTHSYSLDPIDKILSKDTTLAIMPLKSRCEASEPGLIYSGIEGIAESSSCEVWSVQSKVTRGVSTGNHWSKTDDLICMARWLSEDDCQDIERSTSDAYVSILTTLEEQGFPFPFRFWNYLPSINHGDGDDEVYKRFCTGRLNAFKHLGIRPENFPAASALGHHNKGAVIYVFASKYKGQHFRNEKQVNAYEYPRQYGMSSPSFARATAISLEKAPHLFISGTASIIGHKTVEAGKLIKQLEVTTDNIEHLLRNANPDQKSLSTFKVYLRHPSDFEQTKSWLHEHYPHVKSIITLADICRSDLLVEIECFCQ